MRGTWEDFQSKWGFGDGDQTSGEDYEARELIIKELNRLQLKTAEGKPVVFVGFNRDGMHNSCLILCGLRSSLRPEVTDELAEEGASCMWPFTDDAIEPEKIPVLPDATELSDGTKVDSYEELTSWAYASV